VNTSDLNSKFLEFIKLISNEAIYSSSIFCNNFSINRVKSIIDGLLIKEKEDEKVRNFT